MRSRKLIRDPQKNNARVPSGNYWTSQQTTNECVSGRHSRSPKNQSCMSSARPSFEVAKRKALGRAHKSTSRNNRSRHLCHRFYCQLATPAAGDSWLCESRSSWPIKLYDRWQSLSSQVACSVQPRGIVRKINHDVWIAFTGSLFSKFKYQIIIIIIIIK